MEFKIERYNVNTSGNDGEWVKGDTPSGLVLSELEHSITYKIYDKDKVLVSYRKYQKIMAKDTVDAVVKLSTQVATEHPGYELVILCVLTPEDIPNRLHPGYTYTNMAGKEVKLSKPENPDSDCLVDQDGKHYYNSPGDMGRLTGSSASNLGNIRTGIYYSNPEYW